MEHPLEETDSNWGAKATPDEKLSLLHKELKTSTEESRQWFDEVYRGSKRVGRLLTWMAVVCGGFAGALGALIALLSYLNSH